MKRRQFLALAPLSAWKPSLLAIYPQGAQNINIGDPISITLDKGQSFTRDIGIAPEFGVYTMNFAVANYYGAYPGQYEATITIGGNEFCSTYGWPKSGQFDQIELACPVSKYFSVYHNFGFNGNLGLKFENIGPAYWPINIDNVSMTFTPSN